VEEKEKSGRNSLKGFFIWAAFRAVRGFRGVFFTIVETQNLASLQPGTMKKNTTATFGAAPSIPAAGESKGIRKMLKYGIK
jgi:hypothetical protein